MNLEDAYSVGIFVGERIEQAVVDDAEDDGRSSHAEREGPDGDEGEAAVFAKAAEGEAKIAASPSVDRLLERSSRIAHLV